MSAANVATLIIAGASVIGIIATGLLVYRVERKRRVERIQRITEPPRMTFADVAMRAGERRFEETEVPAAYQAPPGGTLCRCGKVITFGQEHRCPTKVGAR